MSDNPTSASSPNRRESAFGSSILTGLAIAMIGSPLLAMGEIGASTIKTLHGSAMGAWPWGLIVASVGKATVSHLLVWCPVMVAVAAAYAFIRRRTGGGACEPFLMAIFTGLAALMVVPIDLFSAGVHSSRMILASGAAVLIGAGGAYVFTRLGRKWLTVVRFQRLLRATAILSIVLSGVVAVVFIRSPLLDPASYRMAAGSRFKMHPLHPHLLWIDLDTVRADHMSCHGYDPPTTPFLQQWAQKSIVFDQAISDGIWTVPSHASMFTGLSVREHGVDYGHLWLDDDQTTIADRLRKAGYQTAFFSNNPWLSHETNLVKGFDSVEIVYFLKRISRFSIEFLLEKAGITPPLPWFDLDFGAALTNHRAAQWIEEHAKREAPIFLFVHYMDAHLPYRVPKRYRQRFMTAKQVDRSYDLRQSVFGELISALDVRYNVEGGRFLLDSDRDLLRHQYDASIRYLDDRVGEIITFFEQSGLLDNTLVVITSDHGECLGTHGLWGHRFQAYNDLCHVSLILREPGRTSGVRVSSHVQHSDLYQTILRALLGESEPVTESKPHDLFGIAKQGGAARVAISQYSGAGPKTKPKLLASPDPEIRHRAAAQIAVLGGRFKYIASADGKRELYDLASDPHELRDLFDPTSEPVKRLSMYLAAWLQAVPAYVPKSNVSAPSISPQALDALRSLGYIDADKPNGR